MLLLRVRRALPRSALAWLVLAFLSHGAVLRVLAASTVLANWANAHERASWAVALGLSLGVLEDASVCVATAVVLWLVGLSVGRFCHKSPPVMAAAVAVAFVLANVPLCVDLVVLRTRRMRFTWDLVVLAWREDGAITQLQVDDAEWLVATEMGGVTLLTALLLCLRLDDRALWRASPLVEWDLLLWTKCSHVAVTTTSSPLSPVRLAKDGHDLQHDHTEEDAPLVEDAPAIPAFPVRLARMVLLWCIGMATTVALAKLMPSLVAMLAWNASLCEPLRVVAGVECMSARPVHMSRRLRDLLDTTTEKCTFVDDNADTLVRTTTGFTGPKAFDVKVDANERPNVLIVVIESFRQRDSRYLIHPSHRDTFLPAHVSLTPQFDQWTRRGIGFRNMWSSWRTSRSLEQILFGQLPLDSATDSGTTNGRTTVRLSGLPQLFKAKGYETLFTTGSRLDYDEWDVFLPNHGFDTCLNGWQLADIGQEEMGIDWTRGDHMMAYWGMHDDLTFEVLGHELKKKQRAKVSGAGKPWFATHYTISSHVPFDERPDWFFRYRESAQMPDLSPLFASIEDPEIRELVQNYVEMRYFSDLTLGSFLGDLERGGVLNDTIVIVTSDHGHSPEHGVAMPEEDQVGAMNVPAAIIAEGRLGAFAGTIIDNVTAQYDWLNTIADIVGLPSNGLLQTGVGRSLKRKPVDEHRIVYSHNPALNLAAVQGHTRIEFFADVPDVVRVFNVEHDPNRENDLRGDLPKTRLREIERICDEARALNAYFTERWHANCLLPPHACQQAPH